VKTVGTFAAMVVFVIACSHLEATPRLKEAQAAYGKAAQGPAAQYSPAELATAKKFLDQANAALETGDAQVVDDRASIALDKIYTAEAIGRGQEANAQRDAALKELNISRDQLLSQTQQQLGKERAARNDAEAQLAKSRQELEHYAQVRELARGTVITLAGGVLFETGKAELLPGAQDRLARVADFLKNSDRSVVVEGYTDSTGSETTNMALSERRAQTVRDYLASQGVPPDRLKAEGKGASSPVASNATSSGRSMNRRVQIVLERGPATATGTGTGTTDTGPGLGGGASSGTPPAPLGTPQPQTPPPSTPEKPPGSGR
jgi:outer membrane protein OmpA-like peptidoglycan-associated protein